MSPNNATLLNRCQVVENTVRNITQKYADLPDKKIDDELGRLLNRAREYEHGTFIVLVVGPAKSGKSTLVNLISGAYVSPTSFLECTVRPSVISRRTGEESSLTVFSSTNTGDRIEQIDSIIDTIRGFGSPDELAGVISEKMPLNDENIRQHVQLGLEKSLDSENLLTSIRTPGGQLLQDRVFIIDMPGFDGSYQNIDNPVYETIAQRADLIIFVQSSNAAFSKVSGDFLKILARNNQNVPVCLVHNVFDAAWWRDDAVKSEIIKAQKEFACNEIRQRGFAIDPAHSFCINLGAVEDFRAGIHDDRGRLEAANADFCRMEQQMYERIISNRDDMRLNNSLARVGQQRDKIIAKAQERIASLSALRDAYDAQRRQLDQLAQNINIPYPAIPEPKLQIMADTITLECNNKASGISTNVTKSNADSTALIEGLAAAISSSLNNNRNEIFRYGEIATELYNAYRQRLTELEIAVATTPGAVKPDYMSTVPLASDVLFDVAKHVDVSNIVPWKKKWYGMKQDVHSGAELMEYIGVVREQLAPTQQQGLITDKGILARTDVLLISQDIEQKVRHLTDEYNARINEYFTKVRQLILDQIIKNPEKTADELQQLTQLVADLKKLSI